MKLIKNLAAALLLASVLSVNVYAGDSQLPGSPQPPKPATIPAEDTKTVEEIQTSEIEEPAATDELWINALMYMLSLY